MPTNSPDLLLLQATIKSLSDELGVPTVDLTAHSSEISESVSDPSKANHNSNKPKLEDEDPKIIEQLSSFFDKRCRAKLARILRKHVVKGNTHFVGDITPFIHEA